MCGIVGFSGKGEVRRIVADGLGALQYRGYDACGCAVWTGGEFRVKKEVGTRALARLVSSLPEGILECRIVSHTRWATHGKNTRHNAHPHLDCTGSIAVVHNGIIENHARLRSLLASRGHSFCSETDTEVLPHLVEEYLRTVPAAQAVRQALLRIEGRFAVVLLIGGVMMVAARRGLPLFIGESEGCLWIVSDRCAFPDEVQSHIPLGEGEIFFSDGEERGLLALVSGARMPLRRVRLAASQKTADRRGYPHYMRKEICEQPSAVSRTAAQWDRQTADDFCAEIIGKRGRLILVGCGTSWHAALVGKYMMEEEARFPVEVDYASEFRYRRPPLTSSDAVLAISQSGETADTMASLELAREHRCLTASICNVPDSSIARMSDICFLTSAGPEIGVASTKAFTSQLAAVRLLSLSLARKKGLVDEAARCRKESALREIPSLMERVLGASEAISCLAQRYACCASALYLGRGIQLPIALEGALKLKEVSYIHAEGYPAAEMKHGPIALVERGLPAVCIAVGDRHYGKMLANVAEVQARGAEVVLISDTQDSLNLRPSAMIPVPSAHELLLPFLTVLPLQLFAYYAAVARGCEVDRPRNLAKSVTVE